MAKGKMVFSRIHQGSQELGTDNEHMVSRVFFSIEVGGQVHSDLYADVKQTIGEGYETGPLEVSFPAGYRGPINYAEFRRHIENYYRRAVGSSGRGINVGPGSSVLMMDNIFGFPMVVDIEVSERAEGW